jgi:hypothetical protein
MARSAPQPRCAATPSDQRLEWRKALDQRNDETLDAPSWLWTSVVDLVATHETAYLELPSLLFAKGGVNQLLCGTPILTPAFAELPFSLLRWF